jgi:hypothetical protein
VLAEGVDERFLRSRRVHGSSRRVDRSRCLAVWSTGSAKKRSRVC